MPLPFSPRLELLIWLVRELISDAPAFSRFVTIARYITNFRASFDASLFFHTTKIRLGIEYVYTSLIFLSICDSTI